MPPPTQDSLDVANCRTLMCAVGANGLRQIFKPFIVDVHTRLARVWCEQVDVEFDRPAAVDLGLFARGWWRGVANECAEAAAKRGAVDGHVWSLLQVRAAPAAANVFVAAKVTTSVDVFNGRKPLAS